MTFQDLLRNEGIDPAAVRLLRHAARGGRAHIGPHAAWQQDRERFETYQATQSACYRRFFDSPYWASFVATPSGETLFVGLYEVDGVDGPVSPFTCPLSGVWHDGSVVDRYRLRRSAKLASEIGRTIDWGPGARAWRQRASGRPKAMAD